MKKKKFDLYKTLRIVFLMLAILTMAMSIVGKGHAEEMTSDTYVYVKTILDDNFSGYSVSDLDSAKLHCPYFCYYRVKLSNGKYVKFLELYSHKNIGLGNTNGINSTTLYYGTIIKTLNSQSGNSGNIAVLNNTLTYNDVYVYRWATNGNNNYTGGVYMYLQSPYVWHSTSWNSDYYSLNGTSYTALNGTTDYDTRANSDFNDVIACYGQPLIQNNRIFDVCTDTFSPISYDDNFSIYKTYGVGGIDDPILNIEYLDNIFSQGYVYTDSTTYSLTFDVDGVESTVSISSTVYPDEFLAHSGLRTSFDLIYRMLSNKILNFSSASIVTLKQVSMTAIAYPTPNQQGTPETVTKSTLCNLNLKGSVETEFSSEVIAKAQDLNYTYDIVYEGDFYDKTGAFILSDSAYLGNIPSWAHITNIIIGTSNPTVSSGSVLVDDILFYESHVSYSQGLSMPLYRNELYEKGIEIFQEIVNPSSLIALTSDVIHVKFYYNLYDYSYSYHGDDGTFPTYVYDVYLFTEKYYNRLMFKSVDNLQYNMNILISYTRDTYDYLYSRLNNISDNIADYFGKDLTNSNMTNNLLTSINSNIIGVMAYVDGINNSILRHDSNISGKLDSILTAINGLNIGGSSLTPLQLTTVLTDLFVPHYQYIEPSFNDYKSQLGILALPFDYSSEVYDTIKSNYSDKMELTIPSASFKADSSTEYTVMQGFDWEFEPETLFSENESIHSIFTSIQYLNAFLAILGASWFTYCHIFRRNETNDN